LAETDVFTHSTPSLYDRYMGPLLFEPYAQYVAERAALLRPERILETAAGTGIVTRAVELSSRVIAKDAAHGIVLGSPFRAEIERLDDSAPERAASAVEKALRAWDGTNATMSAHVATATR
jgi:hypothetical protein